mgnify:FL=1
MINKLITSNKIKKLKIQNKLIYSIHFISIVASFVLSEIYFFSAKGVDFPKYRIYLDYLNGSVIQTEQNQGLFYYLTNYLIILLKQSSLTSLNEDLFLNNTIQTTNFLFYVCGTIGIFKLLKTYGYKSNVIYVSLSVLHFVPKVIEMRVLLKPEIIAFAFLPWIIISFEQYFKYEDKKYLYFSVFPLSLIATSKPSIAGMIAFFLILKFRNKINKDVLKNTFLVLLLFLFICLGLGFENYNANGNNFFGSFIEDGGAYDNVANIVFMFKVNQGDLYYSPELDYHNDSLLGITLLDTFGDYYKVNLKSDDNYFIYNEINPLSESKDSNGFNYGKFFRNYLELLFAVVFYIAIVINYFKNKKIASFILSPLIGIFILLLNAYGIIGRNFDPLKGDTLKVSYYGFFIAISFIFLLCELNKKFPITGIICSLILFISFLFLMGFPKNNYKMINSNLDEKIIISNLCRPASLITKNINPSDCNDLMKITCEYNLFSHDARNILITQEVEDGYTTVYRDDSPGGEIILIEEIDKFIEAGYLLKPQGVKYLNSENWLLLEKNGTIKKTIEFNDCSELISDGYKPINDLGLKIDIFPFVNFLIGILSLCFPFVLSRSLKKE